MDTQLSRRVFIRGALAAAALVPTVGIASPAFTSVGKIGKFTQRSGIHTVGSYAFTPDGTKLYILEAVSNVVYKYELSTPWELSIAVPT